MCPDCYKASKSSIFKNFTFSVVVGSTLLSFSRILALWKYYHAPLTVAYVFEAEELPRLLNVTGFLPVPPPNTNADDLPRIDLSPIKQFDLRLCLGKEWYRFPGHYLVPDGVRVDFVKSDFDGLLPGHFGEGGVKATEVSKWWIRDDTRTIPRGLNDLNREEPKHYVRILATYSNRRYGSYQGLVDN